MISLDRSAVSFIIVSTLLLNTDEVKVVYGCSNTGKTASNKITMLTVVVIVVGPC